MPERLSLRTRRRANERNFGTKSQLQYISKSKTFREEGLAFIFLSPALHVNFGAGSIFMRDWPKPCASVACLSLFLIFSDIVEFTVDKAAQSVWTAGRGVRTAGRGVWTAGVVCGRRGVVCGQQKTRRSLWSLFYSRVNHIFCCNHTFSAGFNTTFKMFMI